MELALLFLITISTLALLCFIGTSIWKLSSHYTISSLVANTIISIFICIIAIPELIISIKLDNIFYYDSILKIILWAFFAFADIYTIKRKQKTQNISQLNQNQKKTSNIK